MADILQFHKAFFKSVNKIDQDNFIIKFCSVYTPKRPNPNLHDSRKTLTFKYFIRKAKDGEMVSVCRETFLNVLGIKRDRVQGVLTRHFRTNGQTAKENRGGDHKSDKNIDRRRKVQAFIESFKCSEPHYCRGKTVSRVYLPAELNIKKMFRMYNASVDDTGHQVRECFFRNVFNKCYNIGFGSPRTDVCSKCLEFFERCKRENNEEEKRKIMLEKKIHNLKAAAFFEILRTIEEGTLTMSFDCQKNMALPKVPDSSAYFSSQLNFYNFAIVVGSSKDKLEKHNVHCYYWNETQLPKGSNEIASALYHRLCNTDMKNFSTLRLIADGCGGQNKNTTLITMLMKWLFSINKHIKTVEIVFPIVGHSFIPPDRVFAQIEKKIRRKEVIVQPEEYVNFIEENFTVWNLADPETVTVYDWREESKKYLKPPGSWHFQFNSTKRFFMQKTKNGVTVQGEVNYKNKCGVSRYVNKKNTGTPNFIKPSAVTVGKQVNVKKLKSIDGLLQKHYGKTKCWKDLVELSFYKDVFESFEQNNPEETTPEDDLECQYIEENYSAV